MCPIGDSLQVDVALAELVQVHRVERELPARLVEEHDDFRVARVQEQRVALVALARVDLGAADHRAHRLLDPSAAVAAEAHRDAANQADRHFRHGARGLLAEGAPRYRDSVNGACRLPCVTTMRFVGNIDQEISFNGRDNTKKIQCRCNRGSSLVDVPQGSLRNQERSFIRIFLYFPQNWTSRNSNMQ